MKINELSLVQKLQLTAGMNYGADFEMLSNGFVYEGLFAVVNEKLYSNIDNLITRLNKNFDLWKSKVADLFEESLDFDLPINPFYEYDNGVIVVDIEFSFDIIIGNFKEWEYNGTIDSDYKVVGIENVKVKSVNF